MRIRQTLRTVLILATAIPLFASAAEAISVEDLILRIADSEPVRIIDIRSSARFTAAHIPGAINVAAKVLSRKRLPPYGAVVVYGDGFDLKTVQQAVEDLNSKAGIDAEMLDGGFPAWEAGGGANTRGSGRFAESYRPLTYQQVVVLQQTDPDLVLVDLRRGALLDLEDLSEHFPGVRVLRKLQAVDFSFDKLYVLIDDGDGDAAEKAARRAAGRGIARVGILAGGELSIRHRGESGSQTLTTVLDKRDE